MNTDPLTMPYRVSPTHEPPERPRNNASLTSKSKEVADKKRISSSLPTPTIVEELQASAQRHEQASAYPLYTRYLPGDINGCDHRPQHQMIGGFLTTPLLLSQEGVADHAFERNVGFLGHTDNIFKYGRLKSGWTSHRFPLCSQWSFGPSEATYTSLHRSWPVVRQGCFLAFFTFIVGLLCLFVGLLISSSMSPCPERHKWYQGALFYEIFPASFQDTDGDGFGDFRGITQRLDYIRDLGIKAIRLNSVFCALDYPLEYEHIIDLRNVDPHLGRMTDFKEMVREAHRIGIKVVLDLNPTVTSDQHTWALHWQRGIDGYQHFYASANRSKAPPEMEDNYGPPPESWELTQRTFGGHYSVNWSSPSVQKEYLKTLNFWIEAGVDGFYMKHLENLHVLESADIRKVILQWRDELDRFRLWSSNKPRVLIASSRFAEHLPGVVTDPGSVLELFDLIDVPVIFEKDYAQELSSAITRTMNSWWKTMSNSPWIMWHVGSSDNFRFADRMNASYREAALHSLLMLPESASVFYGDEIGIADSYDVLTGNVFRGGQFAPMQWSADNVTGGFTDNSSEPWLPLTQAESNVETQQQLLQRFSRFANIHNVHSWNRIYRLESSRKSLFVLERPDSEDYRLLFQSNFDSDKISGNFPDSYREINVLESTADVPKIRWNAKNFSLNPGEAFVAEIHM